MKLAGAALALVAVTGCGGGDARQPTPDRSSAPSALAPGQRCPVSPFRIRRGSFSNVLGSGPLYAAGLRRRTLRVVPASLGVYASGAPKGALVAKTLWVAPPSFRGVARVRVERLDGPTRVVGFHGPPGGFRRELRLSSATGGDSPAGWRNWPTATLVGAAGCYAFRVDTGARSETIVFRAVRGAR